MPPASAVEIADAPPIRGLRFRRFGDETDHHHVLAIANTCLEADGVELFETLDSIANAYRPSATFDPRKHVVLAEVDDRETPIAYSRIRADQPQADGTQIYSVAGNVLPEWRQRGLGTALLAHAERGLRQIADRHPATGLQLLSAYAYDSQAGAREILAANGYRPVPEMEILYMVRPTLANLPPAPLPKGLQVRQAGPEHKRQLWDLLEECSADDLGFTPGTEENFEQWADFPFWDETLWQVAWDGDRPVGMVLNYIVPEENARYGRLRGYTEYVDVARPWRRRGVARALLVRSFAVLKERGMTEAALGVFVNNPNAALRVYEGVGFLPERTLFVYRKPL